MKDHAHEEQWNQRITVNKHNYGIVKPAYTHWTVSYAISLQGAKKLVDAEPLGKLIPVDEYLPLMFDKQPK